MPTTEERILEILNLYGLVTHYDEIEQTIEEIFQEYRLLPPEDRFCEQVMSYLCADGVGAPIAILDKEKFMQRVWNMQKNYPRWMFESSGIQFDERSKRYTLLYRRRFSLKKMIKKRMIKYNEEFESCVENDRLEEYRLKRLFHPDEAYELIERGVEKGLMIFKSDLEQQESFIALTWRIKEILKERYELERHKRQGCNTK